jgi:hypothetical protein
MNTDQLQAALKAAQEAVKHLTELIEGQEPNTGLFGIAVSIADEKEYNAVREVLDANGCFPDPSPRWSDWKLKHATHNFHVINHKNREYLIANHDGCGGETLYTFTEFMTKFAK